MSSAELGPANVGGYSRRTQQLNEYDTSLLLDRTYVHPPIDGFGEEGDEAAGKARPVRTSWAILLYLILLGSYLSFLFTDLPAWPAEAQLAFKATLHLCILLCAFVLESFLRYSHRRRQQAGYLRFYRRTRNLLSFPFQVAALCTPDSRLRHPRAVVEQQCEVIHFLQRRCDSLAHAVLCLQAHEDRAWEAESRADSDHRAAAREAEFRALRAEKEALSQQNRHTWALLEERTNEAHQLTAVKQQHAEENSRLRATLEEWSHRNVG
ncbi:hypothetical protein WJX73_003336 [Symbiochloris irregularis]|uniref:Transmembrane protein n=1 Tax=Symbiochloris irregularis TaxID=706552 RepID=A0AAW1PJP4_9CHLO